MTPSTRGGPWYRAACGGAALLRRLDPRLRRNLPPTLLTPWDLIKGAFLRGSGRLWPASITLQPQPSGLPPAGPAASSLRDKSPDTVCGYVRTSAGRGRRPRPSPSASCGHPGGYVHHRLYRQQQRTGLLGGKNGHTPGLPSAQRLTKTSHLPSPNKGRRDISAILLLALPPSGRDRLCWPDTATVTLCVATGYGAPWPRPALTLPSIPAA